MEWKKDNIGRYISILYRYGQCYIGKKLEPYNIGSGQMSFLIYLFKHESVRQEDLSVLLNIDKGTTARAIKRLEEEGYVIREMDPEDRRAYKLHVTDKAREIEEEVFKVINQWIDILSVDFTEEEKELSIKLLRKMSENAENYRKQCHACEE